jgi:hypothetical protein
MTKNDLEDFDRRISLIFHGAIGLNLLPFVFLYLEFTHDSLKPLYSGYTFLESAILASVAIIIYIAFRNYRRNLSEIDIDTSLDSKFKQVFVIYLGFYIRLFIAGLILVFTYWLTSASTMMVGYVVLLFLLSLHRPTRERFSRDLPLTKGEREFILQKGEKRE